MIQHDPSIFLNRLMVFKKRGISYDQRFHAGVNVIRSSANAVGKTTITDCLFHVLGGEGVKWTDAALSCKYVAAEVELNGIKVVLRREISEQKERPTFVFYGVLEDALNAVPQAWTMYPAVQRGEASSFSHFAFDALGFPAVKDRDARVTMHQIARLLFCDQSTSPTEMLRHDQFIKRTTQEAVGALLLGYYNNDIYELKIKIEELRVSLEEARSQVRAYRRFSGSSTSIAKQIEEVDSNLTKLRNQLTRLNSTIKDDTAPPRKGRGDPAPELVNIQTELKQKRQDYAEAIDDRHGLELAMADAQVFLEALERKYEALQQSQLAQKILQSVQFERCPKCFQRLREVGDADICTLCRTPVAKDVVASEFLKLRHQVDQQLEESRQLQLYRQSDLNLASGRATALQREIRQLENRLTTVTDVAGTRQEGELLDAARLAGSIEARIASLEDDKGRLETLLAYEDRAKTLESELNGAESRLEVSEKAQDDRADQAASHIVKQMLAFLRADPGAEPELRSAKTVVFDFGRNRILIDGQSNYAQSSTVMIRNCFYVSLLFASLDLEWFRFPRFLVLDALDEGGMKPDRNHWFQNKILQRSSDASFRHQIILTTATIASELDDRSITVGPEYNKDNMVLALS
jgi:hypothetical protein